MWLLPDPLVLGSRSEVRRAVLQAAAIPVEVIPADIDERGLEEEAGLKGPASVAMLLAHSKANAVAALMPGVMVLGADQTLALGDQRLSKPVDMTAARTQLLALRGKTHELHSAVAVVRDATLLYRTVVAARMTMRDFSDEFLDRYLEETGPAALSSVGAYQLERTGVHLFERIAGDHFTILGMPLLPLLAFFRQEGVVA
jgi:septum formation protein